MVMFSVSYHKHSHLNYGCATGKLLAPQRLTSEHLHFHHGSLVSSLVFHLVLIFVNLIKGSSSTMPGVEPGSELICLLTHSTNSCELQHYVIPLIT